MALVDDLNCSELCGNCNINFNVRTRLPTIFLCGHHFCSSCISDQMKDRKCITCNVVTPVKHDLEINNTMIDYEREIFQSEGTFKNCINFIYEFKRQINLTLDKGITRDLNRIYETIDVHCEILRDLELIFCRKAALSSQLTSPNARVKDLLDIMKHVSLEVDRIFGSFEKPYKYEQRLTKLSKNDEHIFSTSDDHLSFSRDNSKLITALLRCDNAFVGSVINDTLKFGKITKGDQYLRIGARTSTILPKYTDVIVHHKSFDLSVNQNRIIFMEFEVAANDLRVIRKSEPFYPETFFVYIQLMEQFMENPLAKEFLYLCTGESGDTYINANVKTTNKSVCINGGKTRHTTGSFGNIENKESYELAAGSVIASKKFDQPTCFYICTEKVFATHDWLLIGRAYWGLRHFSHLRKHKATVKDCGIVAFEDDLYSSFPGLRKLHSDIQRTARGPLFAVEPPDGIYGFSEMFTWSEDEDGSSDNADGSHANADRSHANAGGARPKTKGDAKAGGSHANAGGARAKTKGSHAKSDESLGNAGGAWAKTKGSHAKADDSLANADKSLAKTKESPSKEDEPQGNFRKLDTFEKLETISEEASDEVDDEGHAKRTYRSKRHAGTKKKKKKNKYSRR